MESIYPYWKKVYMAYEQKMKSLPTPEVKEMYYGNMKSALEQMYEFAMGFEYTMGEPEPMPEPEPEVEAMEEAEEKSESEGEVEN